MNLFNLMTYARGEIDATQFVTLEKDAILKYIDESRTATKGKSIRVNVEHESFFDGYDASHLRLLLQDYLDDKILEWELDYIFQVLDLLDEDQLDERLESIVFNLANPEINIPINKDNVMILLQYLEGDELRLKPNIMKAGNVRGSYRSILEDARGKVA